MIATRFTSFTLVVLLCFVVMLAYTTAQFDGFDDRAKRMHSLRLFRNSKIFAKPSGGKRFFMPGFYGPDDL
ncbi:unnamed protein product, partial [Mesorhabditis belari]|uniref:Uncharacterized protein n=1 Tax=Mesorhabditis belari TaxID=2138241 RepID=A0AAF3FM36_9BILA